MKSLTLLPFFSVIETQGEVLLTVKVLSPESRVVRRGAGIDSDSPGLSL
jgi:hypothetical protein